MSVLSTGQKVEVFMQCVSVTFTIDLKNASFLDIKTSKFSFERTDCKTVV